MTGTSLDQQNVTTSMEEETIQMEAIPDFQSNTPQQQLTNDKTQSFMAQQYAAFQPQHRELQLAESNVAENLESAIQQIELLQNMKTNLESQLEASKKNTEHIQQQYFETTEKLNTSLQRCHLLKYNNDVLQEQVKQLEAIRKKDSECMQFEALQIQEKLMKAESKLQKYRARNDSLRDEMKKLKSQNEEAVSQLQSQLKQLELEKATLEERQTFINKQLCLLQERYQKIEDAMKIEKTFMQTKLAELIELRQRYQELYQLHYKTNQ